MQQCPVVSGYARKKPLPVRRQRGGQRSQLFIIALNLSRLPELASEFPVQSTVVSDGKAMICSRCINSGKIISSILQIGLTVKLQDVLKLLCRFSINDGSCFSRFFAKVPLLLTPQVRE